MIPLRDIIDPDERQEESARRWLEYNRRKAQILREATDMLDYERRIRVLLQELGI